MSTVLPISQTLPKVKLPPPIAVLIVSSGRRTRVQPGFTSDPLKLQQIQQKFQLATERNVSGAKRLLYWPDRDRIVLTQLMLGGQKDTQYHWTCNDPGYSTLIAATLANPPSGEDFGLWEAWIMFACEILACTSREPSIPLINQLNTAIKKSGLQGYTVHQLTKQIATIGEAIDAEISDRGAKAVNVHSIWPDLPPWLNRELEVPPRWTASQIEIQLRRQSNGDSVALPPVLLSAGLRNHETGEYLTKIIYRVHDEWLVKEISRGQFADARKIIELAGYGLGVNSINSSLLVQYLDDFERHNRDYLHPSRVTDQLGWQGKDGAAGFLLGRTFLACSEETQTIAYHGIDEGMEQFATGYEACGNLDDWKTIIRRIRRHPRAMFVLYASFSAMLLKILGLPNILIDISGPTTTGKTSLLRIAASAWGRCGAPGKDSLVRPFGATATFRERHMQVNRDLPVFWDDTKHARDPKEVSEFIYSAHQGASRGRGTINSAQHQKSTRSVVFLTGEQSAAAYNNDGGAYARVMTLWGEPFGASNPSLANIINSTLAGLDSNYGHAGRKFAEYLVKNMNGQLTNWRVRLNLLKSALEKRAGNNTVARRLAPVLAVIQLAGELAHRALQLPWKYSDPVSKLFDELAKEASQADRPAEALKSVIEYAISKSHSFRHGPGSNRERPPAEGWIGEWRSTETFDSVTSQGEESIGGWAWIGFDVQKLKRLLSSQGYDADAVLRTWGDRGWLKCSAEKGKNRHRLRARVGEANTSVWLVAITHDAYRSVCDG